MPDTTPIYGWPVPVLTDDPNIPDDITKLALGIENTVSAQTSAPVGDSSNSVYLTGSDISFNAGNNKNIVSSTVVLDHDQWVIISARAEFINQTSNASGLIGIYVDIEAVVVPELTSGNQWVGRAGDITERVFLVLNPHSVFLTAGTHTIRLRGDRDGTTATHNAQASQSENVDSRPCFLSIIV